MRNMVLMFSWRGFI